MKNVCGFVFALLVAMSAVSAYAVDSPLFGREDGGWLVEKEIGRPNDAGKNYLTVFGEVAFDVAKLKVAHSDAHFRHIHSNDPVLSAYMPYIGTLPAVLYTKADGTVIHKVSGKNVPKNDAGLPKLISDCRPFRPQPTPAPVQPPVNPEPPVYAPSVVPDTEDESNDIPIGIYAALAALGVLGGAGYGVYKEIKGTA